MENKKWSRWQDWAALIAGAVLALTPLWFDTSGGTATWTMVILGALLALTALWSLAAPNVVASEWIHVVLGVLAFAAPWVVGYVDYAGATWTSVIVGLVAVVSGLWAVQSTTHMFGGRAATR